MAPRLCKRCLTSVHVGFFLFILIIYGIIYTLILTCHIPSPESAGYVASRHWRGCSTLHEHGIVECFSVGMAAALVFLEICIWTGSFSCIHNRGEIHEDEHEDVDEFALWQEAELLEERRIASTMAVEWLLRNSRKYRLL